MIPRAVFIVLCLALAVLMRPAGASHVEFNAQGILEIDGEPFFPLGIYTYHLDDVVMAQLRDKRFNTIINGFQPNQLDFVHANGLKAIVPSTDEWFASAKEHPALIAWYLFDEPEGHGKSAAEMEEAYAALKARDPHHPIGLCHFLYEAIDTYKNAADFTMSDVYPVTASRDVPLKNVGIHVWHAHVVHGGRGWPVWAYIQLFGGPETDGGKWAQPLPHEVRAMTFMALAQGATGILYFSYWPKAPDTWESVGRLNRDLELIIPYLIEEGGDVAVQSSKPEEVWVRARETKAGGVLIAVNTTPQNIDAQITLTDYTSGTLTLASPFLHTQKETKEGQLNEQFGPYEERVYVWGKTN